MSDQHAMQSNANSPFKRMLLPIAVACALALGGSLYLGLAPGSPDERLAAYGEDFVELALSLDRLQEGEVDIYFGPESLDTRTSGSGPDLSTLLAATQSLRDQLADPELSANAQRQALLTKKVTGLMLVLESTISPEQFSYEQEAKDIFGIDLSGTDEFDLGTYREQLEALLPGSGAVAYRLAQFRNQFLVPADKREAVFARALEECKSRSLTHWTMPANENLRVEWSRDINEPWHNFEGNGQSILKINPLSMGYLSSALDVACHETYPGHHAQYVLLEQAMAGDAMLVENSLTLLRSPESSLREGAASYSVDLLFPQAERTKFEKEVLAPIAGLGSLDIEKYNQVRVLLDQIALATIPILRDFSNRTIPQATATFRLEREALVPSPNQLIAFSEQYGAYAASYTLARARIAAYVDNRVNEHGEDPWDVLKRVIETNDLSVLNYGVVDL